MGVSGVPEVILGADVGFTDFSEFAVQGTLPAGITAFGICGGESPTTEEIKNDPSEGNYFSMDGHNVQSWGYGYDAFDALLSYGELLARVWINVVATRRGIGPAINLSGLIGQPCGSPDFDGEGGGVFLRAGVDIESAGSQNNDGSGRFRSMEPTSKRRSRTGLGRGSGSGSVTRAAATTLGKSRRGTVPY